MLVSDYRAYLNTLSEDRDMSDIWISDVWVLTSGCRYEGGSVVQVYSSCPSDELCKSMRIPGWAVWHSWELDEDECDSNRRLWRCDSDVLSLKRVTPVVPVDVQSEPDVHYSIDDLFEHDCGPDVRTTSDRFQVTCVKCVESELNVGEDEDRGQVYMDWIDGEE